MQSRQELLDRIKGLEARHIDMVNERDAANKRRDEIAKQLAESRQEASIAKENLARALGYIDRIHDQEPPRVESVERVPTFEERTMPRGPQMTYAPAPDPYDSMRQFRR